MKHFIREINAFYPAYRKAHSNRVNQLLHFAGATLFFIITALSFITEIYWLIAVAVFVGYLLPGIGHRRFEHNASFRSTKPVLCVVCALLLYIDMLSFGLFRSKQLKQKIAG